MAIKHTLELELIDGLTREDVQAFIDAVPPGTELTRVVSVIHGDRNMMDIKKAKLVATW